MKKLLFVLFVSLLSGVSMYAQNATPTPAPTITIAEAKPPTPAAKAPVRRGPVFRANKDQIKQVQAMLKTKSLYHGESTGKLDDPTRTGIKGFQKDNGLKETGTLNRATLEKMGIELTDTQKAIPVSEGSYVSSETKTTTKTTTKTNTTTSTATKTKKVIFRATREQIIEAQKMLKTKSMYAGEETGKLDDATRGGLKKYQEANGLKATGTLNRVTLEKMGITLTEKQEAQP